MKNSELKWLYKVAGKMNMGIVLLLLVQMVLGLSSVYYAVLLRDIIDNAMGESRNAFWGSLLMLIGLVAIQIILRALVRWLQEYSRASIENALKNRLFVNLLKKDYAAVTQTHSGEWQNRLTSDTTICANGMVEILPGIAGMLVKMLGALFMILALESRFAYILIPGGIVLIVVTYGFRKVLKKLHKSVQEQDGRLRVFMQEHLSNMVIVRSFAAESQVEEEAFDRMKDHKAARMKKNHFSNICNIGFAAAMNGMYLMGLGYGGYGIMMGTVSYGTLTAILQLISQIQSPFASISGYLPRFYGMLASAERLMEAEELADDIVEEAKTAEEIGDFYQNHFAAVGFERAAFTYVRSLDGKDTAVVLKGVSLQIRKGEYVAFVGQSGSGKSTLLKLLMCLYPLNSGDRYLQQIDGRILSLTREWNRLFAYVPQGNQLMSGTIREVVAFSDKTQMYDAKRLWRALEIACADEFVKELENGLDTPLGERGQGLSEGQMQRIAVARALFSDTPILLLDESTSALDEATERRLLENLRNMTDKTVLIVTHRLAALEICDKVVTIDEKGVEVQ